MQLRDYRPADERSWLHCRVLAFLSTPYFDDVLTSKPTIAPPGFSLVMAQDGEGSGQITGVIDVAIDGTLATIETIAVHPDHQRTGLGRALLHAARARARAAGADHLDAWTRDQPETLAWYRARGFAESEHYVHVYANHYTDPAELARAVPGPRPGLRPVTAFLHAPLAREAELRREFRRVHVCRRFTLPL
ncbi:GNAT family N-acetyltransferase [Streptacidiphilus monticola]|uniref:GNAT family N-acetyltransferase n=1 Tax=Streptacidiphilus monticola TaxID=2161674 RepID=A0ABW1G2X6_9ACTN